jgi:hypothetical protein
VYSDEDVHKLREELTLPPLVLGPSALTQQQEQAPEPGAVAVIQEAEPLLPAATRTLLALAEAVDRHTELVRRQIHGTAAVPRERKPYLSLEEVCA